MILGFDVGGTNARALLIDPATGEVRDRDRESSAGAGPILLETLLRMTERMIRHNECEIQAIGLGVAGLAHRSGTIHYSPNLPELVEYPLGTELAARTDLPVVVMNDATAGTWAEAKLGAGRGSDDFMLITLGTGIEGEEIDCRALPEALNSDRAGPGDGVSGRDDEGSVASVNHGAGPEAVDEATA